MPFKFSKKLRISIKFNSWGQGVEKSPSEREVMNRTPCNGSDRYLNNYIVINKSR